MINFTVHALPVAQPRPRATTVNGMARMYEAKKSHAIHDFKASVRMEAAKAYQGPPLDCPLCVALTFVFASKKKSRIWKTTRPDADNLAKGVMDALNGTLFKDDSQIAWLVVRKEHAASNEQPYVSVEIEELLP